MSSHNQELTSSLYNFEKYLFKMKNLVFASLLFLLGINAFAQRTVGIMQNDSSSFNGYTLIAPLNSTETYLIDNCGEVVNSWKNSTYRPGASVYLLDDGSIMRTGKLLTGQFVAGGSGGKIQRFDWNDNLIWDYTIDDSLYRAHHDINILPNGNVLILAWDKRTRAQAIQAGLNPNHFNGDIWLEKIIEVAPNGLTGGTVVWEWYLWDHLIQDYSSAQANFGVVNQNPQRIDLNFANNNGIGTDYFHANGIDYNPDLDQILISVRNYDEIWIIDHSTTTLEASQSTGGNSNMGGDILYRWGNPEAYKSGTLADKKLFGQHNPNWIPKGRRNEGKILVFNNGYNDTNMVSRVHLIDPPVDTAGLYMRSPNQAFGPVSPSWTYNLPVFVDFVSGLHSLPNGNTLICSGPDGHLYEVDSLDNVVWEYISPAEINGNVTSQGTPPSSNTLFRAYKYSPSYGAFANRSLTPNGPIEANPIASNCTINQTTGISDNIADLDIHIVENPISDQLRIQNNTNEQIRIQVFNLIGSKVGEYTSSESLLEIDASSWDSDFYIVLINQGNRFSSQKLIKL